MKHLIIISTLLILISSCGKKTQLKVTAKNAATGEGYAGLGYLLKEVKPYTTSTGEVQKTVYEGTLNQQGEAVFEYKLKDRSYIITTLVPEEELCYINNTQYFLHRDDNDLTFDFRFAECAYLKLKIENVNCDGPDDEIFYQRHWLSGNESSNGITQTGCFQYDGSYFNVPMGAFKYTWDVTRNGITESFEEEFYIEEGGQYSLEILY